MVSCFFSARVCNTKAVDDMASPMPVTSAACQVQPMMSAMPPSTRLVAATCAEPSPKTCLRNTHRREGCNSKPIMNSSKMTPNSEMCNIASTLSISFKPHGPMIIPAAR